MAQENTTVSGLIATLTEVLESVGDVDVVLEHDEDVEGDYIVSCHIFIDECDEDDE